MSAAPEIVLYVVPASHPCAVVEEALKIKRLDYRTVELPPGLSALVQKVRFGRRTVPGIKIGAERVVGSRPILRALEVLEPEPSLLPDDPGTLAAVEEAERWGDEVLQEDTRWILIEGLNNRPDALASFSAGSSLPTIPSWLAPAMIKPISQIETRLLGHHGRAGEYLARLPANLDHVDQLIASGVIGGEHPNVADLQITASVRLLMACDDLREEIDARPAGALARRLMPEVPGRLPAGALTDA